MGVLNVLQSGKSGMNSAKAGIATAGHNISNANTEGFSRQTVRVESDVTKQMAGGGGPYLGDGTKIARIERINDQYLEKQLREGHRDLAYHEEKQVFLNQMEDVFNEMNGDGLNRLVSRFFNEFRKLANDPSSEAIRQSVRESSQAMMNDFRRIRNETEAVRGHIDSRMEGDFKELNSLAEQVGSLNLKIQRAAIGGNQPNDLLDRRDLLIQKMSTYVDLTTHQEESGFINIDVRGVGPLVVGPNVQKYYIARSSPDSDAPNVENALQISRSEYNTQFITHHFQGGKIGGLVELRDKAVAGVLDRLDQMAHSMVTAVNEIHGQGVTADGLTGIGFFKDIDGVNGAAGRLQLSDEIQESVNNIAAGLAQNAPGDNRNALAIANIQNFHLMNGGKTTVDDFYNSIVADVGVATQRNHEDLGQQKGILTQLNKVREQVSGVSIDEETTNLMQFQHAFDASAKVLKVADEMLDTVLKLRG